MSGFSDGFSDKQLRQSINKCMIRDRYRLRGQLRRLKQDDAAGLDRIRKKIESSQSLVEQRQAALPEVRYDLDLPVTDRKADIARAIRENQVVVIAGETGSGKTTQLPKICLEAGRGIFGTIAHTQPRRLAARSVANRIAEELRGTLGEQVGYQVRFYGSFL